MILWFVTAALAGDVVPTDDGHAVRGLLSALEFVLDEPYPYAWAMGHAPVHEGTLLVLDVDPQFSRPRDFAAPVLYVGDVPAELLNTGFPSGHLVVLVPGHPDLMVTPVYFGSTELPERVDAARGSAELAAARAMGIVPFSPEAVSAAWANGGPKVTLRDEMAVHVAGAELIERYAPDEAERAHAWTLPRP